MSVTHGRLFVMLMLGSALITPATLAASTSVQAASKKHPSASARIMPQKPSTVIRLWDVDPNRDDSAQAVDLNALRYYVALNDAPRVKAEMQLLHAEYPNWQPEADLLAQLKNEEIERPLWEFLEKHDFAGLRGKIADMQVAKPLWQPSARLLTKLTLGEARDRLIEASNGQAWADVVHVAATNDQLMHPEDLDVVWRTAEALAHVGDEQQALAVYRFALRRVTDPADRLATVQKASLLLRPGNLDNLLALGVRGPDAVDEFEPLRLDLVRRKIGDAAARKATTPPTSADVDALTRAFSRDQNTGDAQLLGWYAYSRKKMPEAESWFRRAMALKVEAKSAEGLVLALRDEGKQDEARTLAFESRNLDSLNREEMIALHTAAILGPRPGLVPQDRIAALTKAIDTDKSADGAQAFGWYRFKANDVSGAQAWFRKAAEWKGSEPAAIGLMLCANRLKQPAEVAKVAQMYRARYSRVAALEAALRPHPSDRQGAAGKGSIKPHNVVKPSGDDWDDNSATIVKTFQSGDYDKSVALLDARKQKKQETKGLAMLRGWSLYHQGDWEGARKVFTTVAASGGSPDVQSAIRVIDQAETPPRYR